MANNNENKVLNVPNLRFPEFSGEWKRSSLGEVTIFVKERIDADKLTRNNYVSTENMNPDFGGINQASSVPNNTNVIHYQKGDVLLSNIRPYLRKVWAASSDGGCSADVFVFRAKSISSSFLHYIMANDTFINYVMSGAKGVKMPRGDKEQILKYIFSTPNIEEQNKISHLLHLLDERISTQNKIIEKLQSLIKGLPHKAAETGLINGSWEKAPLSTVLVERKELNAALHTVHSVSVSEGVINQIDYLGRSFAAKDTSNYHVARKGDIIYTKSPTGDFPFGIVKQSYIDKPVAISPLYGVYSPISFELGVYLHHYFLSAVSTTNYLYPLVQKGAKNTINISNQRFLENSIPLPTNLADLHNLAKALTAIQKKLNIEQRTLASLSKQKRFILQHMFI